MALAGRIRSMLSLHRPPYTPIWLGIKRCEFFFCLVSTPRQCCEEHLKNPENSQIISILSGYSLKIELSLCPVRLPPLPESAQHTHPCSDTLIRFIWTWISEASISILHLFCCQTSGHVIFKLEFVQASTLRKPLYLLGCTWEVSGLSSA